MKNSDSKNLGRSKVEVDLHLHTTHSDGRLSPTEVVELSARRGLKVIAVTDHDSTDGVAEATSAARLKGLTIIPGVELDTSVPGKELHLLGYFVDPENASFGRKMERLREDREHRGKMIVDKLEKLGVSVSWDRVRQLAGDGSIGRPHVALALVEKGYAQHPNEAFNKYLGRNKPAYVNRGGLTPKEAVKMLTDHGAAAVFAHPTFFVDIGCVEGKTLLRKTLLELKDSGLVGMEVFYGGYTDEVVRSLKTMADDLGLIACGGSDYHGLGNPAEPEPGSVGPPMESVNALETSCVERSSRRAYPRRHIRPQRIRGSDN